MFVSHVTVLSTAEQWRRTTGEAPSINSCVLHNQPRCSHLWPFLSSPSMLTSQVQCHTIMLTGIKSQCRQLSWWDYWAVTDWYQRHVHCHTRLHLSAHQPVDNSSHYQQATWQWYYNNNCAVMQVITDQSVLCGLRNQDPWVTHITIKFM